MTGLGFGTGPHAFVADIDVPVLAADDQHHLGRVLRVRDGDPLTVSDGAGRWRTCRFGTSLADLGPLVTEPAPTPAVRIGFALVKGERPELVVQKLTELGVDRITPFAAARSVVRWDADRAARNVVRLRRVAREAAMQSRRAWLPVVDEVTDLPSLLAGPGVAVAERGGAPPSLEWPTILIGPEGGWAPEERSQFTATVALGPQVLRAETAALTAAALLGALRDGLVIRRDPVG